MSKRALYFLLLFTLCAQAAKADADGPDTFRVVGIAEGDTLPLHSAPDPEHPIDASLPAEAEGLANLGCVGGLSFDAWQNASAEERAAAIEARWCLIGTDKTIGWAQGKHLGESIEPSSFVVGDRRSDLAGSAWRLSEVDGQSVGALTATLAFGADGRVSGMLGCNQAAGTYAQDGAQLSFGPFAVTRKLCPEEQMALENALSIALPQTQRVLAYEDLLALLDGADRIFAIYHSGAAP